MTRKIDLPFQAKLEAPLQVATLSLFPNVHYLFCIDMKIASGGDARFEVLDSDSRAKSLLVIDHTPVGHLFSFTGYYGDQKIPGTATRDGPGANADPKKPYTLQLWSTGKPEMKISNVGVIEYDPGKLPIVVESYTPYRAKVTAAPDHKFIEIDKLYVPGYEAKVNGKTAPVAQSRRKTIVVPLEPGVNTIELAYVGTSAMRIAFYISAIAWLLVVLFLILRWIPRRFYTAG